MGTPEPYEAAALYHPNLIERPTLHIRLLKVWPGQIGEEIVCTLDSHELGQQPEYTALSCAWGADDFYYSITVNRREVAVTTNLYAALQHLRHATLPILLWIDAI